MGKGKILKRTIAWALALAMVLGMLPYGQMGSVLAASDELLEVEEQVSRDAQTESISAAERKIKINDNWRFNLLTTRREIDNSLDKTASQLDYTEKGEWNTVTLPHDWSIYQGFTDSDARAAQGSLPGGTGWYRKSFTLSDDMKGKNVVLQFDAVQMVSEVWINGENLGKQYLGYVTFEYDITDYLRFDGQENVIAVKAYSSRDSARWYPGAGIYGSVYLIATDKVHIPVNGVHVATVVEEDGEYIQPDFHTEPDMEALKKKSTVNVRTSIENSSENSTEVSVHSVIYSKTNPEVAKASDENIQIPAGETKKIDQLIDIQNPDLWNVDDPNLYWVKTEIVQNGEVVDTLDTRFGIRYLYLNPGSFEAPYSENNTQGGLFINGKYTKINGVCEHRDLGALGMETYQAAIDRRIRKLKDMGVNVVRCSHNPVSAEYIEAADRLGMLIFEEGFDQWLLAKNSDDYHNYFNKAADGETVVFEYSSSGGTDSYIRWINPDLVPNCVRDIQAMVDRDKNSPSIFLWSTGNEIYDAAEGHGMDTQWLLSAAVKEIDSLDNIPYTNVIDKENKRTIRPTAEENYNALPNESNGYKTDYNVRGGGARYGRPIASAPPTWDTGSNKVTRKNGFIDNMALADIGGHNYSRANNQYTAHKNRYPNMCVAGTETSSSFYTRGVYNIDHYKGGEEGFREAHYSGYASEWPFNKNFVAASVSIREHRADMMPFLFGEMVWTGHDYLGEPTPHSNPSRSSYFGIIDTAGFEKDAFYMYRSAWTDIPTVHLLPQKWNWDMGTSVPIMVYTNGASVEVFINDKSIGEMEYDRDTAKPVYLDFGMHDYQPGELKAVAKDKDGNVIATDVVYTAGDAQSVVLTGDRSFIKNDGSDLLYVEASVVDSAGIEVPTADNRITFHVEGGEIVALDNGDPRDREPFRGTNNNNNSNTSNNRKAFNGKALAIIKATKGSAEDITVTATAEADGGKLGSNLLEVGSKEVIGDGTNVQSYDAPEVTTGVGITPELPDSVGVIYDNGLIEQFEVKAWDMSQVNLKKPGTYSAYGTASGITSKVEAKIYVKDIESIETAEVTTIAGVAPALPKFVTVHYTDGTVGSAQVTWESVQASKYAEEGIFDAVGSVGENLNVTAEVTVKEMLSIEDITLSTEIGKIPEMPTTIPVKFTDGTEEMLGVKWKISSDDVKSAGVKKITGTVLSSDVTATAWINVSIAVYASDLEMTTDKPDRVFTDQMVNGESLQARGMQGGPGEVYAKGFETKAPAKIEIDIAGKGYERFRSYVNLSLLNGGVTAPGAVSFEVYLDNDTKPVFTSGTMTRANEAMLVDVDVTGASKISLVTKSESGDPEVDLADWVDAKFLSAHVVVDKIMTNSICTNKKGEVPSLPSTVQATVPGIADPVDFTVNWLSPLTSSMFTSGSVQRIYGQLEGADNCVVAFKYITDYGEAVKTDSLYSEIGKWSVKDTFDYPVGLSEKVNLNSLGLAPKMIYSASSDMLVENVHNYGFSYGIYPSNAGSGKQIVFATPDLHYFQIRNVANTTNTSNSNSFTFEISSNGTDWTSFTDFTKGNVLPGTGTESVWAQRDYTSNSADSFPKGTNFLRVTYPAGNTWQFNMTGIDLEGGEGELVDLALFKLGEHAGVIDQSAKTVNITVPSSMDVKNITPEILASTGASVKPEGPQDFTKPVTYTVSNGQVQKTYQVTVNRGVNVTFHPYGGSINGSTQAITNFISQGSKVTAPSAQPVREGYLFGGWTTDRAGKEPVELDKLQVEEDTVLYAIWTKDPYLYIRTNGDTTMKTWQNEKETNYGLDSNLLIRQNNDTKSYGQFGEKFKNTSTSDGTDIKTSLVKFNVKDLKDENVKSVKLALYYNGNENQPTTKDIKILAVRAASDWSENKVTWSNKYPELINPDVIAESAQFQATKDAGLAVELDVSKLYESLSGEETEIAFAITANSNACDFRIMSKEGATGSNASKAPRLLAEVEKEPDYMVTYDLNGGTGTAPIQGTVNAGESFKAAGGQGIEGPNGKQFAGWNTKADGSGTGYRTGDEVVMEAADLTLYAVYKDPVTITVNEKTVELDDTPVDLSTLGLFNIDEHAGKTHIYSVVSGGTGKGRVNASDKKTLTVSKAGTIRIKLVTSETDTHMKGVAIATLFVDSDDLRAIQDVIDKIKGIGTVTLEKKEKIEAARKAYDALKDELKGEIPAEVLAMLTAAEEAYDKLANPDNPKPDDPKPDNPKPTPPTPTPPTPTPPTQIVPKKGTAFKSGALTYKIKSVSSSSKTGTVWVAKTSKNKKLKSVSIPSTVRYQKFTFKVTCVEKAAFKGASKLTTVKIGNNVTAIQSDAFRSCKKLKKVTIGTGLKTVGKRAFYSDKVLKSVVIKSKKLKTVGTAAFKGIHKNAKIKVPKAKLNVYKKKFKGRTNAKITK